MDGDLLVYRSYVQEEEEREKKEEKKRKGGEEIGFRIWSAHGGRDQLQRTRAKSSCSCG